MLKGKIDSYDNQRGFGYIKSDEGEKVFFHISGLLDHKTLPKEGKLVRFVIAQGARGPQAAKIEFDNNSF